jgi:hypothetical protein
MLLLKLRVSCLLPVVLFLLKRAVALLDMQRGARPTEARTCKFHHMDPRHDSCKCVWLTGVIRSESAEMAGNKAGSVRLFACEHTSNTFYKRVCKQVVCLQTHKQHILKSHIDVPLSRTHPVFAVSGIYCLYTEKIAHGHHVFLLCFAGLGA